MPPRALSIRAYRAMPLEKWNDEISKYFVDQLVAAAQNGAYIVDGDNDMTFEMLNWMINNEFNKEFTLEQVYCKVRCLEKKHRLLTSLCHLSGVHFDGSSNTLHFQPFVWEYVCKEYPVVSRFEENGQPDWNSLKKIFERVPVIDLTDDDDSLEVHSDGEYIDGIPLIDLESPPYDDVVDYSSDHDFELGDGSIIEVDAPPQHANSPANSPDNTFWRDLMYDAYASDSSIEEIIPPVEGNAAGEPTNSGGGDVESSSSSNTPAV